jgi:hypothetical protein
MAVSLASASPVALRTVAAILMAVVLLVITPPAAQACFSTGATVGAQLTSFAVPLMENDGSAYVRYDVSDMCDQPTLCGTPVVVVQTN